MKEDSFSVEILEDGTLRIETDTVSPVNHKSADEFLLFVSRMLGGSVTKTKKKQGHSQVHHHGAITHSH